VSLRLVDFEYAMVLSREFREDLSFLQLILGEGDLAEAMSLLLGNFPLTTLMELASYEIYSCMLTLL
jgi:hypothetical protein